MSDTSLHKSEAAAPKLRRNLTIWEAIGVSVALMAPSMAININPQGTAGLVGRAVPLAFVVATVAVLLIAHTFVRLSQRLNHSGSVYGFVGATLGPRAGALSGWMMVGTYAAFGVVSTLAAGIFATSELDSIGLWNDPPVWAPFPIALVAVGLIAFFASRPARNGTRIMLIVEAVTVTLVVVLAVVIVSKIVTGHAPAGQKFTLDMFTLASGTDRSDVFLGIVFAFLSFAGFEAAATLGEEAKNPRKDIPRAILGTALFGGIFFVVITAVEVMGFGANAAGVRQFTSSGSLLGDLGRDYLAGWVGDLITLGAMASAVACALACVVGSSRLMFALSRDGLGPTPLRAVSGRHGVPVNAVNAVVVLIGATVAVVWVVSDAEPFQLFAALGTGGTLVLLVAYVLATLGGIKLLFFSGDHQVSRWEIVIPILSLAVLGYTLFRNVWPLPTGIAWWGPSVAVGWLVVFFVVVLVRPAAARQAGSLLTQAEGLHLDRDAPTSL